MKQRPASVLLQLDPEKWAVSLWYRFRLLRAIYKKFNRPGMNFSNKQLLTVYNTWYRRRHHIGIAGQ